MLDAVTPMLTQAVEAAAKASAARIAKHADAYQGSTAGLAPEQQAAMLAEIGVTG